MAHATVKIKDLVVHKLAQAPDRASSEHVEELRDAIKRGAKLPKPQVMRVEDVGDVPYNGHHTIEAYEAEGYKEVGVELVKGTIDDLRIAAAKANKDQHALKRSRKTKEWQVRSFLEVKGETSNGFIAREVGVSEWLVAHVRKEMEAEGKVAKNGKRVGGDGKVRKMPTKPTREPEKVSKLFDFKTWDQNFGWCVRAIEAISGLVGDKANKKKAMAGLNGTAKIIERWKKELARMDEEAAKEAAKKAEEEKAKEAAIA